MRVSLSDLRLRLAYIVLTAPATKGDESGAMPLRGIARAQFLWLGHELLGVCVDVGIEPPDRLARLLRILDTCTDTLPGGLCLQTLSETSFGSLDVTSLAPHFSFSFQSHYFTGSFQILNVWPDEGILHFAR